MEVARTIARRAPCTRGRIGAVIIDRNNRIVATGYNGPPAGYCRDWKYDCDGREGGGFCLRGKNGPSPETTKSYADCLTIHAESNALSFCDRRDREGGAIYVTGYTCWTCAKLIANSGLKRLVMLDDGARYRDPDGAYVLLTQSGIEVVKLDEPGGNV